MLSNRCKMAVKDILKKLDLHYVFVDLGKVEILEDISDETKTKLKVSLLEIGLELMEDKKLLLMEKIVACIHDFLLRTGEDEKIIVSDFLSSKLNLKYLVISQLFSEVKGITIAQYILTERIEKAKQLIIYDNLNFTEIAWKLNFSNVAHLSNQFKKNTGLTLSQFKILKTRKMHVSDTINVI